MSITYWDEDNIGTGTPTSPDDDDDEVTTQRTADFESTVRKSVALKSRQQQADADENPDYLVSYFCLELTNSQVERGKLTDNSLVRLVTKIAHSTAKGKEKRYIVVSTSNEFPLRAMPTNPDFTEVARTEVCYDESSPTFTLPVKVVTRKGMDKLVRFQVMWNTSTHVVGSDFCIGQITERHSDIIARTNDLAPFIFTTAPACCPRGKCFIWRVPVNRLSTPCSPYINLAAKRHISFYIPYLFRPQPDNSRALNRRGSGGAEEPTVPDHKSADLLVVRESCVEGRFAYKLPNMFFRPLIKGLEAAQAAWIQRFEKERIEQGYFQNDSDAFAQGRVLVRLTVVEAAGLTLVPEEARLSRDDYSGLQTGKNVVAATKTSATSQLKSMAQSVARAKSPSPDKAMDSCHPFVAVILQRPRPQIGVLIGHTNTEYATQNPVFGTNANIKACPHMKPRESFSASGATRVMRVNTSSPPAFYFYAKKTELGKAEVRLEVYQEDFTIQAGAGVQLSAFTTVPLDPAYIKADVNDPSDGLNVWLPLKEKGGREAGRIRVRVSIYTGRPDGANVRVESFSRTVSMESSLSEARYEWLKLVALSGKAPREWDVFTEASGEGPRPAGDKPQLRYPLDWLRAHIDWLGKEITELQEALQLWDEAALQGSGFRSSADKTVKELQGIPTNVHSQTLCITDAKSQSQTRVSATSNNSGSPVDLLSFSSPVVEQPPPPPQLPRKFYYDIISTGAPTAHALGFRRGGLLEHEVELAQVQRDMWALDEQIARTTPKTEIFLPTGVCGELHNGLVENMLKFEAMVAKLAIRRSFCISQALTVVMTSLATKLDIMLTEDADKELVSRTARHIATAGFLVVFQGLISTYGKEHGMLEDVAVAMELISRFSFELLPKKFYQGPRNNTGVTPPSPPPPSTATRHQAGGDLIDFLSFDDPFVPAPSGPSPPPPRQSSVLPTVAPPSAPTGAGEIALEYEFDEFNKRIRVYLDQAALDRLPAPLRVRPTSQGTGLVFPIVAVLFAQGIDAKQTIANSLVSLKQQGAPTTTSSSNSTIQPVINRRSLKVVNDYCHRCYPTGADGSVQPKGLYNRGSERIENYRPSAYGSAEEFSKSIEDICLHPMLEKLKEAVKRDNGTFKNVELLKEQEKVVLEVGGGQVIFCKSGKDRTGMAVTLLQSRILERHGCSSSMERLVRDANTMRLYGTRLLICEKNVGRLKYAFNQLQCQFMPSEYRPPTDTIEDMVSSVLYRDTT